jgi:Protein of unknown function (DUF3592)
MPREFQIVCWLALGLALLAAIARGFWLYKASLTWPTQDGAITRVDIERHHDAASSGGHYFRATFSYDFRDAPGNRVSGSWSKNFSTEEDARDFSNRELKIGQKIVVRFNLKNPALNDLELDSYTYSGDRPIQLSIPPGRPERLD